MGELQTEPFQFTFNGFLKVAFQGSRITSDAGLILVRELDEPPMPVSFWCASWMNAWGWTRWRHSSRTAARYSFPLLPITNSVVSPTHRWFTKS